MAMFHKSNPLSFVRKLYSAYHETTGCGTDSCRGKFEVLGAAEDEVKALPCFA